MGPNADDTPVRPSFKPYTVPRVDCCTTTIINDIFISRLYTMIRALIILVAIVGKNRSSYSCKLLRV